MKQLTCEMCGSTELVKQDGFFVCQTCGCKYSVEEAKKMMIEGTVEVQGTVKVDSSDEIKKLYQAARNARETSDDATALRHYENISAKDPNSWEALFYLVILKTNSIKNSEIASSAISVANSIDRVFQLIKEYVPEDTDKKAAVKEVVDQCYVTATWLTSASHNFYKTMTKGNGMMALTGISGMISSVSSTGNALSEDQNRCFHIANLMCYCGNAIESHFGMEDEDYKEYAVWSWKKMLEFNADYRKVHGSDIFSKESLEKFSSKVKQYDPNYGVNSDNKSNGSNNSGNSSGGCYVATCVYGSYDCPQVWTLRRYRDDTLGSTWYGRLFIRTYYAISPTLVKWFGKTNWFKKLWKGKLDRMVAKLQNNGVEDTPYEDKEW